MPSFSLAARPALLRALVAALALVAASYMLAPRAAREAFLSGGPNVGVGVSSTGLFAQSGTLAAYRENLKKFSDVRDDASDALIAETCYQLPPDAIALLDAALTASGTLYSKLQMFTFSGDEIKTKIIQNVLDTQKRLKEQRVEGPVHVLLTQAPFYRDNEGREMSIQYTIRDYLSKPFNIMRNGGPKTAADVPPIFVTAFVVYAAYTSDAAKRYGGPLDLNALNLTKPRTARELANAAIQADLMRRMGRTAAEAAPAATDVVLGRAQSYDKLCFIGCQQTSTSYPMFCGCATGTTPYASTCLGPTGNATVNADKVAKSTLFFAYKLNPNEPTFLKNGTFEGRRAQADTAANRVGSLVPPLR